MTVERGNARVRETVQSGGKPESGPNWTLHLGDCIAGMRELADSSVDVTITDPPYDEHTHTKGRRGSSITAKPGAMESRTTAADAGISRNRDLGFDAISAETMHAVAAQVSRVTLRWAHVFCAIEMIADWRAAFAHTEMQYVRTSLWHKLGSTPQFTGDRPAVAAEAIVMFHRPGRKRWNGGGKHGWYAHRPVDVGGPPRGLVEQVSSPGGVDVLGDWYEERGIFLTDRELRAIARVYDHPIVLERGHGEVRMHTTQKPLSLMREIVEDFTDAGETVLDPFAGSATTLLACVQLGRRSIGWELSPEYHAIATRRLRGDEARPSKFQPGLFDALGK